MAADRVLLLDGAREPRSLRVATMLLVTMVCLMAAPAEAATARKPADLAALLPKAFAGCFFWWGEDTGHEMRYAFETVAVDRVGRVVATGEGITVAGENVHHVRIRALIDPGDLSLEIRESEPRRISGAAEYVTDGAFRGRLSGDLRRISATWTTDGTGEKGDLSLDAADRAFVAPGGRAGLQCEGVTS